METWRDRWLRGYQLKEIIGAGGFSVVYQAYQPVVEREVAIKAISPAYTSNPEFIRRFEIEAQFIARLEHLHIVPLYDFWRDPDGAYLVMRLFRGGNLKSQMQKNGAWSLSASIRLVDQLASALALAHQKSIIHQDLKPENILLDEQENGYLVDFGIARDALQNINLSDAGKDRLWGTPAYMAPEQVRENAVTEKSDIYSLALIIYTLLSGESPYKSADVTTVLRQKLFEILPPLTVSRPDLPDGINLMIWRATDVQPENRHISVLELANEFRSYAVYESPVKLPAKIEEQLTANFSETLPLATHMLAAEMQNPYKGLRAFEEADYADFFGREETVNKILSRLENHTRFLAVIGPSGSGKSSVVKAGVIPQLRKSKIPGSDLWFITTITPDIHPLRELEQALMRVAMNTPPLSIAEQLLTEDEALHRILRQILPAGDELLLFVNQFEELFTLVEDEVERSRFLNNLVHAMTYPQSQLRVIITLRADYYDRPLHYPEFGNLIRENSEVVLPLSPAEIEAVIVEPAHRVGLTVEKDLLHTIINDVHGQPGMLPLLQFAMTELYEHRENNRLTITSYHAIGGVSGALAKRATELYDSLDETQKPIAQQIFLRLVAPGGGAGDTRRRVLRTELISLNKNRQLVEQVIDLFGKYRLLTFDRDPVTRAPTVEIAHEALIHHWQQLRSWLDTNQDRLRLHRRLSEAAGEWENSQRDPAFLAGGTRLIQFEEIAGSLALNELEQEYLEASIAQRQRNIRRVRLFIAALAITAIGAMLMAALAFTGQQEANRARQSAESERDRANQQVLISRSRELAISALTEGERLDESLLISLEALKSYDTLEARRSLLMGLVSNPYPVTFLHGHTGAVRTVAVSPDGKLLASGGDDKTVRLWDTTTHQPIGEPLTGHTDTIWKVAFSPDGQWVASASHDTTVRLWNLHSPDNVQVLEGHTDKVWDVAFSPDGKLLASAGSDGNVILWDITSDEPVSRILSAHTDAVFAVAFSPDGKLLASGGADLQVILWDLTDIDDVPHTALMGHQNWILTLAFNPDGTALASSGPENDVLYWNVLTKAAIGKFSTGHTDWVRDIAISPDGQKLATASADNTIRIWNLSDAQLAQPPLTGHTDAVWEVAFLPESIQLISASSDKSLIQWSSQPVRPLAHGLETTDSPVWSVAFTPDGCQLAGGSGSLSTGEAYAGLVWQIPCEKSNGPVSAPSTLTGHLGAVTGVALSPDGQLLVTGSVDRRVMVWNLPQQELVTVLDEHASSVTGIAFHPSRNLIASADSAGSIIFYEIENDTWAVAATVHMPEGVTSLAFSPDGEILAAASQDNTIVLWDSASYEQAGEPLTGHTDDVETVAFSPDGKMLASGSRDNTIILWNTTTRTPLGQPLTGHVNWITSLAFSPDGKILASGSRDTTILLWDVATGQPFSPPLVAHTDWVTDIAFSPDGKFLASGGRDGQVFLWDVSVEAWKAIACQIANRNLTVSEWQAQFGNLPYEETCPVNG